MKIKSLVFFTVEVITLFFFASSLIFANVRHEDNPCSDLTGTWKGKWENWYIACKWDAEYEMANYKQNIQIIAHLTLESGNCYKTSTRVINGTCVEGKLNMKTDYNESLTGYIFGKMFTLTNNHASISGTK